VKLGLDEWTRFLPLLALNEFVLQCIIIIMIVVLNSRPIYVPSTARVIINRLKPVRLAGLRGLKVITIGSEVVAVLCISNSE
jgi:hypothetical protein